MDTPLIAAVEPVLASSTYGKSRVRLMKLERRAGRHDLKEITFQILFSGDFASCYETGDNSKILPTDTMKNTVYAMARKYDIVTVEGFSQELIRYFLKHNAAVTEVRIDATEHLWARVSDTAFTRESLKRTSVVTGTREHMTVEAGIDDLVILKSSGSAFHGYIKDPFTTLKETNDRIFSTAVRASWRYGCSGIEFNDRWDAIRRTIIDTFAGHESLSVQHTLHAVGKAVLASYTEVAEIQLTMPNKHALLVDLSPFGMDNPNEVFLPIDDPSGYIEARLVRPVRATGS